MAYTIKRINADSVIDFAALELKKYLRMLLPRCGEIKITYDPDAKDGFRLGTYADFGMETTMDDPRLDDEIYIKTDKEGGIIAGSNPRAVLIAVYRFLRENGCRWMFPGPDGEYIPSGVTELVPVSLTHKADHRYRGQCNEGAETQPSMMDAIDFAPKVGMNCFMMEFDIPRSYYYHYFNHEFDDYKEKLPSNDTILRWKRACDTEITKRGMLSHDMGHGWTAEPFGLVSGGSWYTQEDDTIPEDTRRHLAMMNGKRGLFGKIPLNTNVCMSNPETRKIVAKSVADYSEVQNNVDFLHVWLADATNNHCECDECRKKTPSDWYLEMMNDIDDELTARNLDTHIVFIAYNDTIWPPRDIRIKNPNRFTMLFAPISRLYTESYTNDANENAIKPFVLNNGERPRGMSDTLGYLKKWKEDWSGDCFCYEYHFWRHQYYDIGGKYHARRIYEDVQGLAKHDLRGIIEDGSQRSFFPNGFSFYVYGETLFDKSRTFEELEEDYFSRAYGSEWRLVNEYLETLSELGDFAYMSGLKSKDETKSRYYNPEQVEKLEKIAKVVDDFKPVIERNLDTPDRNSFVAWDMLIWHGNYVKALAKALILKATDKQKEALDVWNNEVYKTLSMLDYIRHDCLDIFMLGRTIQGIFKLSATYVEYEA